MRSRGTAGRARWRLLVAGGLALATAGGAAGYTAAQAQHNLPTARVLVSIRSTALLVHGSGRSFAEQAAASYAEVATSPLVLDRVIDELELQTTSRDLGRRVTSTLAPGTMVIDISVAGGSRVEEARIANAVSRRLVQVAGSLSPTGAASRVELRQIGVAVASD